MDEAKVFTLNKQTEIDPVIRSWTLQEVAWMAHSVLEILPNENDDFT